MDGILLGMVVCLHGNGWFIFQENIERKDNPTARSWSDYLGLYWYVVVFGSYGRLFSFSRKNGRLSCNRNIELTRNVFLNALVIKSLPFGKITLAIFTVLSIIFYATTIDSSAYVISSICAKT